MQSEQTEVTSSVEISGCLHLTAVFLLPPKSIPFFFFTFIENYIK